MANIESKDPIQIISGNEKVVRPRLADAVEFFNTDRKSVWKITCRALQTVLFQQQLARCATRPTAFRAVRLDCL